MKAVVVQAVHGARKRPRCGRLFLPLSTNSPVADRLDESAVVAHVLIGVLDRELADRVIEGLPGAHVAGEYRRIAGVGVCARQRLRYENALAGTINGLYKAEPIYQRAPPEKPGGR